MGNNKCARFGNVKVQNSYLEQGGAVAVGLHAVPQTRTTTKIQLRRRESHFQIFLDDRESACIRYDLSCSQHSHARTAKSNTDTGTTISDRRQIYL